MKGAYFGIPSPFIDNPKKTDQNKDATGIDDYDYILRTQSTSTADENPYVF